MNHSVFVAIGNPAIRPTSFVLDGILRPYPPYSFLCYPSLFAAGQVRAQCGSLSAPSTIWSDGNGSWGVTGNWTSGTPNASTNACILDGTSTVTLDTNGSAKGLQIASGNIFYFLNSHEPETLRLSLSGASFNYGTIAVFAKDSAITILIRLSLAACRRAISMEPSVLQLLTIA